MPRTRQAQDLGTTLPCVEAPSRLAGERRRRRHCSCPRSEPRARAGCHGSRRNPSAVNAAVPQLPQGCAMAIEAQPPFPRARLEGRRRADPGVYAPRPAHALLLVGPSAQPPRARAPRRRSRARASGQRTGRNMAKASCNASNPAEPTTTRSLPHGFLACMARVQPASCDDGRRIGRSRTRSPSTSAEQPARPGEPVPHDVAAGRENDGAAQALHVRHRLAQAHRHRLARRHGQHAHRVHHDA